MSYTKIFGLGGVHEIGKSTLVIHHEKSIAIIDAGIKFADSSTTGLHGIIPNYSYLKKHEDQIEGIFVTHGHEDHIGGIIYLLQQVKINKIFAPKIAIEYLKYKLEDRGLRIKVEFIEIKKDDTHHLGSLVVDFWTAQHSIPDAFGIRVKTPDGSVLCTGDFRIDYQPIGNYTDFSKLEQIGKEGLTLLLSDSTNAMRPNHSPSENDILKDIEKIMLAAKRKIIITTFASNLIRIKVIIELAEKLNKKIAVFGRSMVNGIAIGKELGYIKTPDSFFIDKKSIDQYEDKDIVILTTGSQGEQLAALSRMSYEKHPQVSIRKNDTIIFSSSPIPGNKMKIELLINRLYKLGAIIKENGVDGYLHTSGHAYQEEHEKIFSIAKPKYFFPYHGEYRMSVVHGQTAIRSGVKPENVIIPGIGEVVKMEKGKISLSSEKIEVKPVYIDGETILTESDDVVNERILLGENGFVFVVVLINKEKKIIIGKPKIISKGAFYVKNSNGFVEKVNKLVHGSVLFTIKNDPNWTIRDIQKVVSQRVQVFFYTEKRRRPLVSTTVFFTNEKDDSILEAFNVNKNNVNSKSKQKKKTLLKSKNKSLLEKVKSQIFDDQDNKVAKKTSKKTKSKTEEKFEDDDYDNI